MSRLLWVLLVGGLALPVAAQSADDPLPRTPRTLGEEVLASIQADEAFRYDVDVPPPPQGTSLWEALARYLDQWLGVAFSPLGRPVTYFVLAMLVLWGLLKLLRIEPSAAFRRAAAEVRATGDMPDDLSALDYHAEAQRARASGDVRLAVRYLFLHVLQKLDAAGRIAYRPEKTNRTYLAEVGTLRPEVEPFVRAFEHAWYGHVEPGPSRYDELEAAFARVEPILRDGR